MDKAYHPHENYLITHTDYNNLLAQNNHKIYKEAGRENWCRCPVCNTRVIPRAGHNGANGHFAHEKGAECPTKTWNAERYMSINRRTESDATAERRKNWVTEHMDVIYQKIEAIVPYINLKNEFAEILKIANNIKLYHYVGLQVEYIPYIYVTLIRFIPRTSENKKRKFSFNFYYDSNTLDYKDVWVNKGKGSNLFRISFKNGQTCKITPIKLEIGYLEEEIRKPLTTRQKYCYANVDLR